MRKIRLGRRQCDEAILDVLAQARREGVGWMNVKDIVEAVAPGLFSKESRFTTRSNYSFVHSLLRLESRGLIESRDGIWYRLTDENRRPRGRRRALLPWSASASTPAFGAA